MSIQQQMSAKAESLTIPQLQMAIKNGTVDSFIGIPLLQRKVKQRQQAMAMQQAQQQGQNQVPLAAQVMQDADQYRGIDELPTNLPTAEDDQTVDDEYANGGIIAFAEPTAENNNSRVTDPDRRSPSERARDELIARINNSENNNTVIPSAANTGVAGATPEIFAIDGVSPEFGGSTISADQDAARVAKIQAERAAIEEAQRQRFLRQSAPQLAAPETESSTRGSLTEGISPADVARTEAQLPKGITALGGEKLTPRVGLGNAPPTLAQAEAAAGKSPAAAQAVSAVDRYMAMLEKSGESVGREKKEAFYMALISGGLTAAGGTSPNALANIAAGMVPATQQYQKAISDIRKDDRARVEKLLAAGMGKEKLALELKKLGIEEKKVDALVNLYNAKAGAAGGSGDAAQDRIDAKNQVTYVQATRNFNAAISGIDAKIAKVKESQFYGMDPTKFPNLASKIKAANDTVAGYQRQKQTINREHQGFVKQLGVNVPDYEGRAAVEDTVDLSQFFRTGKN